MLERDYELRLAAYRTREDDEPGSIMSLKSPSAPSSAIPPAAPLSVDRMLSGTHRRYLRANSTPSSGGPHPSASQRLDADQQEGPRAPVSLPLPGQHVSELRQSVNRQGSQGRVVQDPASMVPYRQVLSSAPPILQQEQSMSGSNLSPATSSITSGRNMSPVLGNWSLDEDDSPRAVSLEKRLLGEGVGRTGMHYPDADAAHGCRALPIADDCESRSSEEDDLYGPSDSPLDPRDGATGNYSGVQQLAFAEASEQARTRLMDAMQQANKTPGAPSPQMKAQDSNRMTQSKEFWLRRAQSLKALTSEQEHIRLTSRAS